MNTRGKSCKRCGVKVHRNASMVVPLIEDAVWKQMLSGVPEWAPPPAAAVILSPHPDDETLGVGALVASLRAMEVDVRVVAATDGEGAYPGTGEERAELGRIRLREQACALAKLNVPLEKIVRLHLPDSGLTACEDKIVERLRTVVEDARRSCGRAVHLIAPWTGDFHPDHEACARAAERVAEAAKCGLTFSFFWTWHRGTPNTVAGLPLRRFVPSDAALRAKAEALACHASQLGGEGDARGRGDGAILPKNLLGPAEWPWEIVLPVRGLDGGLL